MSIEDETELKDLLMQTLIENGSLGKIKAQLRASVFLALEEEARLSQQKPFLNEKVKSGLNTYEGQLMFCIVKQFLEHFNLQSTMAVFDAESYLGISYDYKGQTQLSTDLGLVMEDESIPVLQHIVQLAQQKPRTLEVNLNIHEENAEFKDDTLSSSNSLKIGTSEDDSNVVKLVKNNHERNVDVEILRIPSSEYNHDNDYNESLNKTFVTVPCFTQNNTENLLDNNSDSINNTQENISETYKDSFTQITSPEVTTPILKESKISPERIKSPPKSDKFKSKNNLNSLSDLPPLPLNRSLSGKILPSLYTKEIREKLNS